MLQHVSLEMHGGVRGWRLGSRSSAGHGHSHLCEPLFVISQEMGVPLMDFAKWVGNLKPGRIVYSSPNACPHWDLLLRLNWSTPKPLSA